MPLSQLQVRCLQTPHEPPRARQQIPRSRALPQMLTILIAPQFNPPSFWIVVALFRYAPEFANSLPAM